VRLAEAAKAAHADRLCKFGELIAVLDEDDLCTMAEWIDEGRSVTWIASVLKKADLSIHRDTVRVHLRGLCSCPVGSPHRGSVEWQA
jgi:hypothetical protein